MLDAAPPSKIVQLVSPVTVSPLASKFTVPFDRFAAPEPLSVFPAPTFSTESALFIVRLFTAWLPLPTVSVAAPTVTALDARLPFSVRVPALTVVAPLYVLAPPKTRVPAPAFFNPPDPLPAKMPLYVIVFPLFTVSDIAFDEPRAMPRFAFSVKSAVAFNSHAVLPEKVICPAVAELGTVPKRASELILTVPAVIVVAFV